MGNREDLLAGARRCLEEKGYLRTTVRDIATAAKVSMAAIGYHFGSREALLNEALIAAIEEWGAGGGGPAGRDGSAAERYAALWDGTISTFESHRWLWLASVEAFVHAQTSPELREILAVGQREGRRGVTAQLTGGPEDAVEDSDVRTLGSVHLALMSGVMIQWLTDPGHAPDGREIVAGLRALANLLEARGEGSAPPAA
ncbi:MULTISPECIES: TetR/AcrR family transcriptional regulator [unclassified Streptomyces]|uniref:TetR/AcrR family transcriptional regulator n=1 Tax=unclassified Streptomyces TaxID=2593676 RepID=UPI003828E161